MKFPKKSLGQNFLIDKNIIKKILKLAEIKGRHIIEIGPGKGALTDEIIKREPVSLSIIEKDLELSEALKKRYKKHTHIKIYNHDVLKFDLEKIIKKKTIIFGNLPYNISSQILVKIIKFKKWPPNFLDLIFMFQKELGEKIIGKFGTKNYGRLSILSNLRLKIEKKFLVSSSCFWPKPKVLSMVIHFSPKKIIFDLKNVYKLEKITKIFFSNKRKMINKNIKKILSQKKINMISKLNLKCRPSEINPEIYYKITELYEEG